MTPELAHDYIRRRMDALGHKDNYHIRFRHFVLSPHEVRVIEGGRQLFLLAAPADTIRIESDTGIFDLSETKVNELQYEHQGTLRLTNYSSTFRHLPMIEVIIK
jgi:hypothetical protein